jgi:hypothetical protein
VGSYVCRGTWLVVMLELLVPSKEAALIARLLLLLTAIAKVPYVACSFRDLQYLSLPSLVCMD